MTGPTNGEVVTDSSVAGVSLAFGGYTGAPNDPIKVQVLNEPTLNPADPANWTDIATTSTSTTADGSLQGTWYAWETDAVVVDPNDSSTAARWPQGGLARLRAVRALNGQPLATFDAITGETCVVEHLAANETPEQIGSACQGLGKTNAAVVSTTPLPAATTFLTRNGVGDVLETAEYYVQIQAPPTIGEFLAKYHFPAVPVRARYYNDGDLGLGRDMNCWKDGNSTVCFVVNYDNRAPNVIGDPLSFDPALYGANYDPDFAGDPQHALAKLQGGFYHFATVAMVYTPSNGGNSNGPNAVKFMVYGADGNLALAAKLDDKEENTSIPQNCLSCHGINATYDPVTNTATGGEFLPFDPFSFTYSTQQDMTFDAQVGAFRELNALVRAARQCRSARRYGPVPRPGKARLSHVPRLGERRAARLRRVQRLPELHSRQYRSKPARSAPDDQGRGLRSRQGDASRRARDEEVLGERRARVPRDRLPAGQLAQRLQALARVPDSGLSARACRNPVRWPSRGPSPAGCSIDGRGRSA